MNRAQSLALYREGREAWNAWAEDILARRAEFEEADTWNDVSRADFTEHEFDEDADFSGHIFPGDAGFDAAKFSGVAGFRDATFSGDAWFQQSSFKGFTSFKDGTFNGPADFSAIKGETAFSLEGAGFNEVPDFYKAHFEEAPRLVVLSIEPRGLKSQVSTLFEKGFKTERDLTSATRWSELKRLAVQRHDHQHELAFFRGELLERRGAADKVWHAGFWFGIFYQIFSGFGRSVLQPFIWWAVGVVGFAWLYLAEHVSRGAYRTVVTASEPPDASVLGGVSDWIAGTPAALTCIAGPSDPWSAALGLSLQKALFAGIGSVDKTRQIYACLFGIHETGPLAKSFQPIIPDSVSVLGIVQFVWSAAMIFLVLLALRNHFRIK